MNYVLYFIIYSLLFVVLYREGPGINHADYIVVINFGEDSFDWVSMLGHVRMATTTVKVNV